VSPREVVAVVRASPFRSRLSAPALPSLHRPSTRAVLVAAALAGALALAYGAARTTSLFAVRDLDVAASSPSVAADVRAVVETHLGSSLVGLDAAALEARLRAIPTVRAATVDRAFPHTLAVTVEAERPLAVVPDGERAWLVGASGRVLQEIEPTGRPRLARIRLRRAPPAEPGAMLKDRPAVVALRVLDSVPRRLARETLFVTAEDERVIVVLRDGLELRLGEPSSISAKLAAATAVLRALPAEERAAVAYLDASVAGRVVAGSETEPSSETSEIGDEVPAN
jgi:cell division protein FtsQ